jgi:hypothetical protein
MVRLKYSLLAKLFALVCISFFTIPSLLRYLNDTPDDGSINNSPSDIRRNNRRVNEIYYTIDKVIK